MVPHFIQGMSLQSLSPLHFDMLFLGEQKLYERDAVLLMKHRFHRAIAFCKLALFLQVKWGEKSLNASIYLLFGTIKCHWREHLENFSGCAAKKNCNKLFVP